MNAPAKIASRQGSLGRFRRQVWSEKVDVRGFIQGQPPYLGDAAFLARSTARTTALWAGCRNW